MYQVHDTCYIASHRIQGDTSCDPCWHRLLIFAHPYGTDVHRLHCITVDHWNPSPPGRQVKGDTGAICTSTQRVWLLSNRLTKWMHEPWTLADKHMDLVNKIGTTTYSRTAATHMFFGSGTLRNWGQWTRRLRRQPGSNDGQRRAQARKWLRARMSGENVGGLFGEG